MTQAEKKAKELVDRFDETLTYLESKTKAKECALICVDEKFKSINDVFGHTEISIKLMKLSEAYKQLTQVKKEINKL
mgnify:FL=1